MTGPTTRSRLFMILQFLIFSSMVLVPLPISLCLSFLFYLCTSFLFEIVKLSVWFSCQLLSEIRLIWAAFEATRHWPSWQPNGLSWNRFLYLALDIANKAVMDLWTYGYYPWWVIFLVLSIAFYVLASKFRHKCMTKSFNFYWQKLVTFILQFLFLF